VADESLPLQPLVCQVLSTQYANQMSRLLTLRNVSCSLRSLTLPTAKARGFSVLRRGLRHASP
jgi:hypothetical protein